MAIRCIGVGVPPKGAVDAADKSQEIYVFESFIDFLAATESTQICLSVKDFACE